MHGATLTIWTCSGLSASRCVSSTCANFIFSSRPGPPLEGDCTTRDTHAAGSSSSCCSDSESVPAALGLGLGLHGVLRVRLSAAGLTAAAAPDTSAPTARKHGPSDAPEPVGLTRSAVGCCQAAPAGESARMGCGRPASGVRSGRPSAPPSSRTSTLGCGATSSRTSAGLLAELGT